MRKRAIGRGLSGPTCCIALESSMAFVNHGGEVVVIDPGPGSGGRGLKKGQYFFAHRAGCSLAGEQRQAQFDKLLLQRL